MKHCGIKECLPHNPSIISPCGLPDRCRSYSPHVGTFSCLQFPTFSTVHYEWSIWPATRRVNQPAVFMPMIRPLSNSLSCEKCLLTYLPGILRFLKFSYNRHVIVTFINLPLNVGLYDVLFLIAAPLQGVRWCTCHQTWIICLFITCSSSCLQSFAIVCFFLHGGLISMFPSVFML